MKRVLIIFAVLSITEVNAQKIKEGIIRYSMVAESVSAKTNKPIIVTTENVSYFKNGKSLYESVNKYLRTRILNNEQGMLMLMDGVSVGYKTFYWKSRADQKKVGEDRMQTILQNTKIIYPKGKKKILGYECSEALITFTDPKGVQNTFTFWYTEKIQNFESNSLGGGLNPNMMTHLKGMPLEIDMQTAKTKGKMIVTSISTKPVPDAVFALSSAGYTELKPKGLNKSAR
jgi:hypothetical protein